MFRPSAVGIPVQTRHLKYHWDGSAVRRYFDYAEDSWVALDPAAGAGTRVSATTLPTGGGWR